MLGTAGACLERLIVPSGDHDGLYSAKRHRVTRDVSNGLPDLAHHGAAVLRATSNTLQSCTGCHAALRQEVVSAAEWQQRTGQAPGPAKMHGEH